MSRFNTPEEVIAFTDMTVLDDYERHIKYGIDLNPFSTDGARNDWQRGFNNTGPRTYELPLITQFDTIYQRGRSMARLLQSISEGNEHA